MQHVSAKKGGGESLYQAVQKDNRVLACVTSRLHAVFALTDSGMLCQWVHSTASSRHTDVILDWYRYKPVAYLIYRVQGDVFGIRQDREDLL